MIVELLLSAIAIGAITLTVRYHWITRKQPVRKTAPTGNEPWVRPESYR